MQIEHIAGHRGKQKRTRPQFNVQMTVGCDTKQRLKEDVKRSASCMPTSAATTISLDKRHFHLFIDNALRTKKKTNNDKAQPEEEERNMRQNNII